MGVGVTVGEGVAEGVAGRGVAVGRAVTVGMGVIRSWEVGVPSAGLTATGSGVINWPHPDVKSIIAAKSIRRLMTGNYTTTSQNL